MAGLRLFVQVNLVFLLFTVLYLVYRQNVKIKDLQNRATSDGLPHNSSGLRILHMLKNKTAILGVGTNREDMLKMTSLLNQQDSVELSFEWRDCFNLEYKYAKDHKSAIDLVINRFAGYANRHSRFFGDIAIWNLPYVERALEFQNVRVLAFMSPQESSIKSLAALARSDNSFPWLDEHSRHHKNFQLKYNHTGKYDDCFRQYDYRHASEDFTIEQAIQTYVKDYYETVDMLAKKYPSKFWKVDVYNALHHEKKARELNGWLGIGYENEVNLEEFRI